MPKVNSENRLSIQKAAELMGVCPQFVRVGIQQGKLPFGFAVKGNIRWSYFISAEKFTEHTGIRVNNG